ncbi:hypothetical protein G4H71_18235 [Rhodococcus triatomae]|uniref:Uncharacterized protein n=1 Tax=Rhodococcus triatomae TaxID=300028 RepID=A0A1G8F1M6_9NOCA|nr:hypothetical protein [Rhodococcus triatomae]QNG19361.1 hypothetical protein G4H72_12140 [Rhodococcus triatomae]QNG24726.1 hypothetical protein G4H71_18235 [Rhodococcus triatomae]SDH76045.1 hypothetical protein SAMN05444695_103140 [Rhodococcus triatomae]
MSEERRGLDRFLHLFPPYLFGGKVRTSTIVLCLLWLVVFTFYIYLNPDAGTEQDSRVGPVPQQTTEQYVPEPTETAPTTTPTPTPTPTDTTSPQSPEPGGNPGETGTGTTTTTTPGGLFPQFVPPWETEETAPPSTGAPGTTG